MILTPEERVCSLHAKLDKLLAERLKGHRNKNDGLALTERDTAALRGRISEVKKLRELLAMDAPSPEETADGQ